MRVLDPKDASLGADIERAVRFAAMLFADLRSTSNGWYGKLACGEQQLTEQQAQAIMHACQHQKGDA